MRVPRVEPTPAPHFGGDFKCECGQSLSGAPLEGLLHFCGPPHYLSQVDAEKAWNENIDRLNSE